MIFPDENVSWHFRFFHFFNLRLQSDLAPRILGWFFWCFVNLWASSFVWAPKQSEEVDVVSSFCVQNSSPPFNVDKPCWTRMDRQGLEHRRCNVYLPSLVRPTLSDQEVIKSNCTEGAFVLPATPGKACSKKSFLHFMEAAPPPSFFWGVYLMQSDFRFKYEVTVPLFRSGGSLWEDLSRRLSARSGRSIGFYLWMGAGLYIAPPPQIARYQSQKVFEIFPKLLIFWMLKIKIFS